MEDEKKKEVSSSDEEKEEVEETKKAKSGKKDKGGQGKGGGGKKGKGGGGGGGGKGKEEERAESILTLEEIGRMIDLGLGRGVDATNPSPWLNKSAFQVREVTPFNIIGTDEGGVIQKYVHEVTSVQAMQTNMSATVPASQQISVGIDAELSRSYSSSRKSIGKKIVTRSISYKADFDDLIRQKSSPDVSPPQPRRQKSSESSRTRTTSFNGLPGLGRLDSSNSITEGGAVAPTFEERLARWILEQLAEENVKGIEEFHPNDNHIEVMTNFIAQWPKDNMKKMKQMIGKKCREFINHFRITHYVCSIDLGASKYRVMSEEEYQTQIKTKGSLGIDQVASAAVEQKVSFGRKNKASDETIIGRFDGNKVIRGTTSEAVVGVKFQPISALVRTRIIQNKLKQAIRAYIDNQEHSKAGPFIISCKDESIFLKVTPGPEFKVMGTRKIEESSNFFISSNEDGDNPYEFSIMYLAESPMKDRGIKPVPRYLFAPVNTFGKNNGPLMFRLDAKDTKTKLTLHSRRVRLFNPVDTKDWITSKDIFYINCKQRAVRRNGYICVKKTPKDCDIKEEYITCCVPTIKKHDESTDHSMLFRLIRAGKKEAPKKKKGEGESDDEDEEEGGGPIGEDMVDSGIGKKREGGKKNKGEVRNEEREARKREREVKKAGKKGQGGQRSSLTDVTERVDDEEAEGEEEEAARVGKEEVEGND